ncbi:carboxylesterase family protein [Sphingomonas sp. BIUV-7]|uniref:Carboxylic ester hydrolase n=1 Tax=Sphingomonas natans TaxID=3063330 RepID=A0ABT8Y831_9SPHN|nr:carboxylesterase family protein [Sphingomonas sp. BIUV-7]MDO6414043.1 carboxylesterase family protein [Sphingomonas sp. BIUV-7]
MASNIRWSAGSSLGAALTLICGGLPAAASGELVVRVSQGALRGTSADGVEAFQGIPFAQPPVGDYRWRPPGPAAGWSGVRDATAPGAACVQGSGNRSPKIQSEDCLFVNVWRPAGAEAGGKLPVMLWIHGGGFVAGVSTSPMFNGTHLAQKGVILVSFNYRLGRLGFFAHPALSAEAGTGLTANYGTMDQIAALKWVRANIAAFGGDPDNITLFGESSGGQSVNTLMVSPLSRGLFAKAISESGLGRNLTRNAVYPVRGDAAVTGEKAGLALAAKLGVPGTDAAALKALRALPADQFVAPLTSEPGAILDGILLPEPIAKAFAAGHEAKVPYIVGANSCERCGVQAILDDPDATIARAGPLRARLIAIYGTDPKVAAIDFASDADHVEPSRELARLHARNGLPSWHYNFGYLPSAMTGRFVGVPHGAEVPFVFGTFADGQDPPREANVDDRRVSEELMTFWTNFAKTSAPGTAGNVRWPRYEAQTNMTLTFSTSGPKAVSDFRKDRLDFAESVAMASK